MLAYFLQALASLPAVKQWLKETLTQHNGRLEQALFATLSGIYQEYIIHTLKVNTRATNLMLKLWFICHNNYDIYCVIPSS